MTTNTDREELALLVSNSGATSQRSLSRADAILAAGYRKVNPADEAAVDKVAAILALSDGWLSAAHPSPRHQAELRKRAGVILTALYTPEPTK
ncbi:hypothetical protein [Arthrobacter luteolus]|uniref:hypothetical protein n=1 Tax=Arthrobacter luteolus TaxID=98672 RepID=UPI0008314291|nr:hypothetical protein [Arthrobacter luteolus]